MFKAKCYPFYAEYKGETFKFRELVDDQWFIIIANDEGEDRLNLAKKYNFQISEFGHFNLPVTADQIDNAYKLIYYGTIDGYQFRLMFNRKDSINCDFVYDTYDHDLQRHFGLPLITNPHMDNWFRSDITKLTDCWESREPIPGFPFKGPEKIYIKFDGVMVED